MKKVFFILLSWFFCWSIQGSKSEDSFLDTDQSEEQKPLQSLSEIENKLKKALYTIEGYAKLIDLWQETHVINNAIKNTKETLLQLKKTKRENKLKMSDIWNEISHTLREKIEDISSIAFEIGRIKDSIIDPSQWIPGGTEHPKIRDFLVALRNEYDQNDMSLVSITTKEKNKKSPIRRVSSNNLFNSFFHKDRKKKKNKKKGTPRISDISFEKKNKKSIHESTNKQKEQTNQLDQRRDSLMIKRKSKSFPNNLLKKYIAISPRDDEKSNENKEKKPLRLTIPSKL